MNSLRTGIRRSRQLAAVMAFLLVLGTLVLAAADGQATARLRALSGGEGGPPSYDEALTLLHDLVGMGEPAVAPLLDALRSTDPALRAHAAFALGRLRSPQAVGPLLAALNDLVPDMRAAVSEALGCIGDPRAVEALLAGLAREHEMDQRGAAVALGALRARAAVGPLQSLLASANWETRWRAAVALGQIGDRTALPALGALANDRDPVTAAAAAWARAAIQGDPMPGGLAANLSNPDEAVVRGSAWALGVIGTDAAVQALTAGLKGGGTAPDACRRVLHWLGPRSARGGQAVPPGALAPLALADIGERWLDRYGDLVITVSEPFVISRREAQPERGAHARPRLFRLSGGLLLAFDRMDGDEGPEGPAALLRSGDGGRTWQDVTLPLPRVDAVLATTARVVRLWDRHAFEKAPGVYAVPMCVSEDGGGSFGALLEAALARPGTPPLRTLSALRVQPYAANGSTSSRRYSAGLRGNVVQCANGSLLAAAETRGEGDGQTRCVSYRSTDGGMSWTGEATIAGDGSAEPALAGLADGRIVAMADDLAAGALVLAWSTDGGQSWIGPVRCGAPGAAPSCCLASGGVLACSYTQDGPRLMFSVAPDAKRWTDRIRPVAADAGAGRGYTSIAEVAPGRLLLVYDAVSRADDHSGRTAAVMGCEVSVRRATP